MMTSQDLLSQTRAAAQRQPIEDARLLPEIGKVLTHLADHEAFHGSLPSSRTSAAWRGQIVAEIAQAGLLGRGGAAFPTARKLKAVMRQAGPAMVIANGTEGEPASLKDRRLLARAPHLVLDGASLAAEIVEASDVVVVAHGDVRATVDAAVAERREAGIDRVSLNVVTAADGFVAGEASAVVNWVAHSRPVPLGKPPRLAERGLAGRPTLVQNVETLAHLALIARHGADWYRMLGTPEEPGSTLVTIQGAIDRPGVYEVEIGLLLAAVLERAGGPSSPIEAFLIGGYFGRWVPATPSLSLPFSARGMGVGLGAGVIVALPANVCGLAETARLASYLASQSAGQCGPCVFGLAAIAEEVRKLADGRSRGIGDLERWLIEVEGRGACGHPDGTARQIVSALSVFAAEVDEHLHGWCTAASEPLAVSVPLGALR